ncbi:hypothetical protein [Actinomycetospora sp. CA-084318]|uniref:hypothetical protein n=1 Tax=Actinomycetospora sp. CA-084318 TaxID=3239892 RepID=UPI003D960875
MADGGPARWAVVTGLDDARRAAAWLAAVAVDSLDLVGQGLAAMWLSRPGGSRARQPQPQ